MSIELIKKMVRALEPGQWLTVAEIQLVPAGPLPKFFIGTQGDVCTPADRILEGICGSAYEFSYVRDTMKREVTFKRLDKPLDDEDGRMTYVSPDRRKYYDFDGQFYVRNSVGYKAIESYASSPTVGHIKYTITPADPNENLPKA